MNNRNIFNFIKGEWLYLLTNTTINYIGWINKYIYQIDINVCN